MAPEENGREQSGIAGTAADVIVGVVGGVIGSVVGGSLGAFAEATKEIRSVQDAISHRTKIHSGDLMKAIGHIHKNIDTGLTQAGSRYMNELQNKLNELDQPLHAAEMKRTFLQKAEEFCEEAVKSHLEFLSSAELKGVPKVFLDFNGKMAEAQLTIYVMPEFAPDSSYSISWIASLNAQITLDMTMTGVPPFQLNIRPNEQGTKERFEEIRALLAGKQDELIASLAFTILEDYMPPLQLINETIRLFE